MTGTAAAPTSTAGHRRAPPGAARPSDRCSGAPRRRTPGWASRTASRIRRRSPANRSASDATRSSPYTSVRPVRGRAPGRRRARRRDAPSSRLSQVSCRWSICRNSAGRRLDERRDHERLAADVGPDLLLDVRVDRDHGVGSPERGAPKAVDAVASRPDVQGSPCTWRTTRLRRRCAASTAHRVSGERRSWMWTTAPERWNANARWRSSELRRCVADGSEGRPRPAETTSTVHPRARSFSTSRALKMEMPPAGGGSGPRIVTVRAGTRRLPAVVRRFVSAPRFRFSMSAHRLPASQCRPAPGRRTWPCAQHRPSGGAVGRQALPASCAASRHRPRSSRSARPGLGALVLEADDAVVGRRRERAPHAGDGERPAAGEAGRAGRGTGAESAGRGRGRSGRAGRRPSGGRGRCGGRPCRTNRSGRTPARIAWPVSTHAAREAFARRPASTARGRSKGWSQWFSRQSVTPGGTSDSHLRARRPATCRRRRSARPATVRQAERTGGRGIARHVEASRADGGGREPALRELPARPRRTRSGTCPSQTSTRSKPRPFSSSSASSRLRSRYAYVWPATRNALRSGAVSVPGARGASAGGDPAA